MNFPCLTDVQISQFTLHNIDLNVVDTPFDFTILALGYESRATHIIKKFSSVIKKGIAFKYPDNEKFNYKKNQKLYEKFPSIDIVPLKNLDVIEYLIGILEIELADKNLNVLVDISSFSRVHLSQILEAISEISLSHKSRLKVTLSYSDAKYSSCEESGPIVHAGPVIPELAGWPTDPTLPVQCFLGLGYEIDKAMGIVEYLEPHSTWAFTPIGRNVRYDNDVAKANNLLFKNVENLEEMAYHIDKPVATFGMLSSLVGSFIEESRPVLVPLGPKLFFILSVLVAKQFAPEVAVWRVSSDIHSTYTDRVASGEVISIELDFG